MATFGPIASAMPNVLYNPMAVDQAVQGRQRNQLMMDNARQDQAQQTFQRDATARIGMARELSALPEQEAAAQWGSYRQRLQSAGLGQGLPDQFPGMERIKAVAASDLTAFQRMQIDEKRRSSEALMGLIGGGVSPAIAGMATGQPAPAAAAGVPVAAPGGNMYGRNAPAAVARDGMLDAPPTVLAAASSARAGQSGLPTNAPYRGATPSSEGGDWDAGIAPPTGAVPALAPGGSAAPVTAQPARAAAPAAPAAPAGPALLPNGLTQQQAAQLAVIGQTNPQAAIQQMGAYQQQNRMAQERAQDDARQQQQRREDLEFRRNSETRQIEAARLAAERDQRNADRQARLDEEKSHRETNPGPSATDRTKLRTIETEAEGILGALETFRTTRQNASTGSRVASAAGLPTDLNTSYANATLLAKGEALYNLGVLNGPDLSIIRRALADPGTIAGGAATQATVNSQIDQIKTLLQQRLTTARAQYGGAPPAGQGGVQGPTAGSTAEPPAAPAPGGRPPLSSFGR